MKKVKFIVKSKFGAKGEERDVTDRAAEMYERLKLIEPLEKEEKQEIETKEEKQVVETKKAKVTRSPKL